MKTITRVLLTSAATCFALPEAGSAVDIGTSNSSAESEMHTMTVAVTDKVQAGERRQQSVPKNLNEESEEVVPPVIAVGLASDTAEPTGHAGLDVLRLAQALGGGSTSENAQNLTAAASESNNRRLRRGIEEIVVTAQRREERLHDVPISLAVVTADDIDQKMLVSGADYLRGVPGVNQTSSAFGENIIIRGIETQTEFQNAFSGSTVATYFGETPTTQSGGVLGASLDVKLVDIERVEVLRGPQGTAFGSGSLSGAVRTIPVAPKLDSFEGRLLADYSVTSDTGGGNYNVQAVGNFPLIKDKLALRAVLYQFENSGFYRNLAGSDPTFRTSVVNPYGMGDFARDRDEVGDQYAVGGRVAALLQASDNLRLTLSYLKQQTEVDGWAGALNLGPYKQTLLQLPSEHVRRGESSGYSDGDIDLANATVEYQFAKADLLLTYSYQESVNTAAYAWPSRAALLPVSQRSGPFEHTEHVGEIRLATRFDGAWNFVVGAYGEDLEDVGSSHLVWYGDPSMNLWGPDRVIGFAPLRNTQEQQAAFGEVSWTFLPGLTLTAGARSYQYDRAWTEDRSGGLLGSLHLESEKDASGTSYRSNISYKPNENALVYVGWSQGFRLGKPQFGLNASVCDLNNDGFVDGTNITLDETRSVESDSVNNYEIGGNVTLLDSRLIISGDVYRMDWKDMPFEVVPPGQCGGRFDTRYTDNVGNARSEGVELQANLQLTDSLRVDLGGSWVHAELRNDVPALNLHAGDRLPGAPEYNANLSVQYAFNVGDYSAFFRADSIYVGDYYGAIQRPPVGSIPAGEYVKVDASARLEMDNIFVTLFVKNLTNEDKFTFRGGGNPLATNPYRGYLLRPRTVGIQIGYDF